MNESTANQSIIQSQQKCDNHDVADDNFHLLMRRKLSKVDQKGSAWNILCLCKYYILKLRALCNMAMEERSVIRQKLLKTLTEKRSKFTPLWASCYTRCGLVPDLSCGAEHHRTNDIFFGQLQNLWPHFDEGGEKPAKDIMSILSKKVGTLGFEWTEMHQHILTQHIWSVLAAKQPSIQPIRNTAKRSHQFISRDLHLAMQGANQGRL